MQCISMRHACEYFMAHMCTSLSNMWIYDFTHKVAKTHTMPHLYWSFVVKDPYNWWLFCKK